MNISVIYNLKKISEFLSSHFTISSEDLKEICNIDNLMNFKEKLINTNDPYKNKLITQINKYRYVKHKNSYYSQYNLSEILRDISSEYLYISKEDLVKKYGKEILDEICKPNFISNFILDQDNCYYNLKKISKFLSELYTISSKDLKKKCNIDNLINFKEKLKHTTNRYIAKLITKLKKEIDNFCYDEIEMKYYSKIFKISRRLDEEVNTIFYTGKYIALISYTINLSDTIIFLYNNFFKSKLMNTLNDNKEYTSYGEDGQKYYKECFGGLLCKYRLNDSEYEITTYNPKYPIQLVYGFINYRQR